jgi:hypothetical protein
VEILGNLISIVLSGHAPRWVLPLVCGVICYKIVKWIDSIISSDFRIQCANFLLTKTYQTKFQILPDLAEQAMCRIFGDRHFSKKCVLRSAIFSVGTLFITFILSFLYDPKKTVNFCNKILSLNLNVFLVLLLGWIFSCLVPDYIMLGKTREIIWILRHKKLMPSTLCFVGILDFFVATWIFLSFLVILLMVGGIFYKYYNGDFHNISSIIIMLRSSFTYVFPVFLFILSIILIPSSILYISFPFANFFWTSMIPSIWLWLFIFSSIISQFFLSFEPKIEIFIRILDIENYPIRSIGIIASILVSVITFVIVLLLTILNNSI